MTSPNMDLNETIVSAIKARVETGVLEALSGDEFFGRMVHTALNRKVEVKDGSGYRSRETTYITHVLEQVMQNAVKDAVTRLIQEETPVIEEAVRKELRKNSSELAGQLVGSLINTAKSGYGIRVDLKFPGRD